MPTSLRTLQSSLAPRNTGEPISVFFVGNKGTGSPSYCTDGCCCLWTVPANIRSVTFEAWGGGGDGGGGCCCMSTAVGATGGAYAVTTIDVTANRQFRICAAYSGCCTNTCTGVGTNGFPSYVYDVTNSVTILCACGGLAADMTPTFTGSANGYTCCWGRLAAGGYAQCGYVVCGQGGTGFNNQWCHSDQYVMVSGGQMNTGRLTADKCSSWGCQGCAKMAGPPSHPGGAGMDGFACGGGYCSGQWGAAGLVKISYR